MQPPVPRLVEKGEGRFFALSVFWGKEKGVAAIQFMMETQAKRRWRKNQTGGPGRRIYAFIPD
jgi:hypothetical protein